MAWLKSSGEHFYLNGFLVCLLKYLPLLKLLRTFLLPFAGSVQALAVRFPAQPERKRAQ